MFGVPKGTLIGKNKISGKKAKNIKELEKAGINVVKNSQFSQRNKQTAIGVNDEKRK